MVGLVIFSPFFVMKTWIPKPRQSGFFFWVIFSESSYPAQTCPNPPRWKVLSKGSNNSEIFFKVLLTGPIKSQLHRQKCRKNRFSTNEWVGRIPVGNGWVQDRWAHFSLEVREVLMRPPLAVCVKKPVGRGSRLTSTLTWMENRKLGSNGWDQLGYFTYLTYTMVCFFLWGVITHFSNFIY